MPKKTTKKKAPAGKRKKNTAAEPMPSLIFSEGILPAKQKNKTPDTAKQVEAPAPAIPVESLWNRASAPYYNPTAKIWTWFGVIFVSLLIIILWGFSFKERLTTLRLASTPEGQLVTKTQTDWNTAFAQGQAEANNEVVASQIKAAVSDALAKAAGVSTTTATSTVTIAAVSSTPAIIGPVVTNTSTVPTPTTIGPTLPKK